MDWSGKQIAELAVGVALLIAIVAGVVDFRQRRRRDLDRVTLLDWRSVQVFALIAMIVALALAAHL